MSQFSIDEWMTVTLTHVSKRLEVHGAEKKHAMDLAWRLEGPNTLLDKFPGNRRDQLYHGDASETLPGVDAVTNHLRLKSFEGPFKMPYDGTGYLITIEDGAVSGSNFELGSSDINKFAVAPKDGGSIVLTFRTQHVGLDQATMGRIVMADGKTVRILAAPPALQDGVLPERKLTATERKAKAKADAQAAFTQDLPLDQGEQEAPPEAGDVFSEKVLAGETTPAKPLKAKPSGKISLLGSARKPRTGKGN